MNDFARELAVAIEAAHAAGSRLRGHYAAGSIAVETKSDRSPVTAADRDANDAIVSALEAAFPADAILSEESPDDGARLHRPRVWIVDPLDGTRDFVARSDDFCVHVALSVDGELAVGVVHHVVPALTYFAIRGGGAFVRAAAGSGEPTSYVRLAVSKVAAASEARVGVSRLNVHPDLQRALNETSLGARAVARGASVKLMAVARGELDAVVSFTPAEMEWDTAAPELVIREAGGQVADLDGAPLRYNQPDVARRRGSIASNGACHAAVRTLVRPWFTGRRTESGTS